jgi:hypothetical protein
MKKVRTLGEFHRSLSKEYPIVVIDSSFKVSTNIEGMILLEFLMLIHSVSISIILKINIFFLYLGIAAAAIALLKK